MGNIPTFKIRCSAIHRIMAGTIGLTDTQKATLQDLELRAKGIHPKGLKLTDNMRTQLADLIHKRDNPELPEGAKSYCKEWLKQTLYGRREQVKSKYIEKGHSTEEEGFTAMAVQLKLGMVHKNEEFKEDEFMMGTCDLDHEVSDTVYDNKSSWSLDQFPMFENEIPSKDYEDQIQGYMHLFGRKHGAVVYTLNDIDLDQLSFLMKPWLTDNENQDIALNLIYTQGTWAKAKERFFPNADDINFIEIPEKDRVKPFYFEYDADFIARVRGRVKLCRNYIESLLSWATKRR